MNQLITALVALVAGGVIVWLLMRLKAKADARQAGLLLETARKEAESIAREARLAAQDEIFKGRETFEKETKERREQLAEIEKRILARETNLERKAELLDKKTDDVEKRERDVIQREKDQHMIQLDIEALKRHMQQELQRVAGLSAEEAKRMLLADMQVEIQAEASAMARRVFEEAKQDADREAKRVITTAIERCAAEHVQAATSCTITLPSEEMKGRIIGREGRNIRAFEAATGINVLIDDTPQAVVLSGFDPVRREIARLTLEQLISDGRINPARIEEVATKASQEIDALMIKAGEEAVDKLNLPKVHPELIKLLGRLKFRHSFAQNVLDHSVEVAQLESLMAAELGLNQQIAKRAGLFHDIGKAVDHEVEGSHAIIGAQLLKKFGESEEVCQAVACHHHEVEPLTVYGVLASAADAMSASRPGARSESMELYLQRLEKLEAIANSFKGVEKSFALQAGREIRVIVEPKQVNDDEAARLAREITKKIESDLQYPGQIKVTVVRELRATEYAK